MFQVFKVYLLCLWLWITYIFLKKIISRFYSGWHLWFMSLSWCFDPVYKHTDPVFTYIYTQINQFYSMHLYYFKFAKVVVHKPLTHYSAYIQPGAIFVLMCLLHRFTKAAFISTHMYFHLQKKNMST